MMVLAPLSARLVERSGTKVVVGTGLPSWPSALLLRPGSPPTSSDHVILVTMVLGLGMANIMAPATESIMGSLPRAKAGVGSAVNDTTRQVGGAVGVALLGSLMSTRVPLRGEVRAEPVRVDAGRRGRHEQPHRRHRDQQAAAGQSVHRSRRSRKALHVGHAPRASSSRPAS